MAHSKFLAALNAAERTELERKLLARQSGKCFICDETIDLMLHDGRVDVDHIIPLSERGPDDENNFALTHASCNRSKGAADLRVARRMAEFALLQQQAVDAGKRGANLGDMLERHNGGRFPLRLKIQADRVEFSFASTGDNTVHSVPLYLDERSNMRYFFALLPLAYITTMTESILDRSEVIFGVS